MKPNEGRLQTGEHILAKILENKIINCKVRIAKFFSDYGEVEFLTTYDLRKIPLEDLNFEINKIVKSNLNVNIHIFNKMEIKDFEKLRVNKELEKIRIVSIGDFDSRPCGDPHINKTLEIGNFYVEKIKRVGNNRYRITFRVE